MPDVAKRRRRKIQRQRVDLGFDWFWISVNVLAWILFSLLVRYVDPEYVKDVLVTDAYLPFFALLMVALMLTVWNLTKSWGRTVMYPVAVIIYLVLRLKGLGHYLNALLIGSMLLAFEYYFMHQVDEKETDDEE